MVEGLLSIFTAPDLVLLETIDIEMKYNAHFSLVEKRGKKQLHVFFSFIAEQDQAEQSTYVLTGTSCSL